MAKKKFIGESGMQILVGGLVMFVITVSTVGLLVGWRVIPGWVGESFGMVAGVMSTPFFMEASFAVIGLMAVLGLNSWRRHKNGDEFVTLEVDDAAGKKDSE